MEDSHLYSPSHIRSSPKPAEEGRSMPRSMLNTSLGGGARYSSTHLEHHSSPQATSSPRPSPSPRYSHPPLTPRPSTPRASSSRESTPRNAHSNLRSHLPLSGASPSRLGRRFHVVTASEEADLDAVSVLTESTCQSLGRGDIFNERESEERHQRYRSNTFSRNAAMSPHYEKKSSEFSSPRRYLSNQVAAGDDEKKDQQHGVQNHTKYFSQSPRSMTRPISSPRSPGNRSVDDDGRGSRYSRHSPDVPRHETSASSYFQRRLQQHESREDADTNNRNLQNSETREDAEASSSPSEEDNRSLFTEQVVARKARTDLENALLTVENMSSTRGTGSKSNFHDVKQRIQEDSPRRTYLDTRQREHNDSNSVQTSGSYRVPLAASATDGGEKSSVSHQLHNMSSEDNSLGSTRNGKRGGGLSQSASESTIVQEFESAEAKVARDDTLNPPARAVDRRRYPQRDSWERNRGKDETRDEISRLQEARNTKSMSSSNSEFRQKLRDEMSRLPETRNASAVSTSSSDFRTRIEKNTQDIPETRNASAVSTSSSDFRTRIEKNTQDTKAEEVEKMLQESRSENAMLQRSLAIKDRAVSSLQSEVTELNGKIRSNQSDIEALKKEETQRKHRIAQQEGDLKMITHTYDEVKAKNDSLREEAEELRQKLRTCESKLTQLDDLESKLEESEAALAFCQNEKDRLEETSSATVGDLERQLSEKDRELSMVKMDFQDEIEYLQKENISLKNKLESHEDSQQVIEDLEKTLSEKENETHALQRRVEELSEMLEERQLEIKEDSEEINAARQEVAELKEENSELKREIEDQRNALQKANETPKDYQSQLQEREATVKELQRDLENKAAGLKQAKELARDYELTLQESHDTILTLERELENQTQKAWEALPEEYNRKMEESHSAILVLQRDLDTQANELREARELSGEYEAKLRESHATIMTLKSALTIKEQNYASITGQATEPFDATDAQPMERQNQDRNGQYNGGRGGKVSVISDENFEIETIRQRSLLDSELTPMHTNDDNNDKDHNLQEQAKAANSATMLPTREYDELEGLR